MTILGMNFLKIEAEKKAPLGGKLSINNNVSIKDVQNVDVAMGKDKQKALRFMFEFASKYEQDFGHITISGEVVYLAGDDKKTKEIADSWKKDKKVPPEIMSPIMNTILAKANVEAIMLSRDMNLPPPLPMPKVTNEKQDKEYIG